jgi:hypothetical protein
MFRSELMERATDDSSLYLKINQRLLDMSDGQNFTIGYRNKDVDIDLFDFPSSATHKYVNHMGSRVVRIGLKSDENGQPFFIIDCMGGSIRSYKENSTATEMGGSNCKPGDKYLFDFEGFALIINFPII